MIADAYNFLVSHGLWHYVVGWSVGFFMSTVLLKSVARPLWAEIREHLHLQRAIADKLDTSTEGGLTDVVEAINGRGRRVT